VSDVRFIAIEKFESEQKAAAAAAWLEADGIVVFIEGASASTALSYTGVAAVRLMVKETQEQAAKNSLAEYQNQTAEADAEWYCCNCQETNEGSFDICWKCQRDRQEVEGEFPLKLDTAEPNKDDGDAKIESDSTNPYQPARAKLESSDTYAVDQAEAVIDRAYRSAVLGVGLPILLTPYSIVLLLASYDCNSAISESSRKRRRFAWIFNFVVLSAWGAVLAIGLFYF
jgi:hypothetical protein